jgi:hypothetical protein
MSDPNDNQPSDAANPADELVLAIRNALASDASPEMRAGGASACRAILRGLEPSPHRNGAPASSPAATLAGTPLGAALGAFSSIPREQILELVVSGLRSVLGQGAPPTYRPAPLPRAASTTERAG